MKKLTQSIGHEYTRILGMGGYRGSKVVTNAEMCAVIDSSDEWIRKRTGIIERRWINDEETPRTMAVAAAKQALERAKIAPEEIGALVISSVSHHQPSPSLASYVAKDLQIPDAAVFDVSAACAGFCYGVSIADSLVRTGTASYALVIGVENLSKMIDMQDRATAFLFGDGAGAAVIGPSDEPGISSVVWGSDPSQAETIQIQYWNEVKAGGDNYPVISMEGNKVYLWTLSAVAEKCRETIEKAGISAEDLDVFVPHQANDRIIDALLRHLKLPDSVVVSRDIRHMGNASAASIPLAVNALLESGEAKSGQTALIIGFGAGLVYAGQVVTLP